MTGAFKMIDIEKYVVLFQDGTREYFNTAKEAMSVFLSDSSKTSEVYRILDEEELKNANSS